MYIYIYIYTYTYIHAYSVLGGVARVNGTSKQARTPMYVTIVLLLIIIFVCQTHAFEVRPELNT